ncbi:anhydro-N-acetylmuramic acid kinase [Sulfurimonas sp.]|uniref:anhydro-N-acetylmuramic acid kinase n=1 Tax=Sulfurimonas sp. TaxID=2022749 RepID=UPI0025E539F8|nr:anhydro-N-acetylmuramic acid kinase [Sulfurimonas sp.]MCK9472772.1 anhydro-N-acetylmuramic acid kinase [Sulfurimonas sp.]MDD3505273.1 anhydro-N-acetylmuramic acid kinase [Sulfurimonas sp.]
MSEFYIGVMSGTSLDGIDIAYCEIKQQSFELLCSGAYSFDKEVKKEVLKAINAPTTLKKIGELDMRLGKMYADALERFISEKKIDKKQITAIGLHGQTLWHNPDSDHPFSMQLGDSNIITALTGVRVVSDFRRKDIALGGQGAPFAPAFHQYVFSRLKAKIAVVNIGGMANLSILGENLTGYDTGCGNVLMDYWVSLHNSATFDEDGRWAKSGTPNNELLQQMLSEPYFSKKAPKSTGRELFNKTWLERQLEIFMQKKGGTLHIKNRDMQATLLELTVSSIANEVRKNEVTLLIVCGGGVKNGYLMQRLADELRGVEVASSDECGVSSKFMEAMAFAWLAHERVHKNCVKLSSVTGASKDSLLGAIYE